MELLRILEQTRAGLPEIPEWPDEVVCGSITLLVIAFVVWVLQAGTEEEMEWIREW
jgi:hypothetical protein